MPVVQRALCSRPVVCAAAAASALVLGGSAARADDVSGFIVIKEGDALAGSTVSTLNAPFTDGNGEVSFVIGLADNARVIWHGTGAIFHSGDALPDVLTGGEGTHGVGNAGQFIYSPSFNGEDAVYSNAGKIVAGDDPAPNISGQFITFASRPQMRANGTALWVSGLSTTAGGTSAGRALYSMSDVSNLATATPLLRTGDEIQPGRTITASGVGFDYWISDNGNHHIHGLIISGATASDNLVWVNGSVVAQEGSPTGQGDNWANFDVMSINDSGNYIFSGDTAGDTATDEFLAYNGAIALREGTVVDGLQLGSSMNAASINDNNEVAFIWTTANPTGEALFYAADGSNLAAAILLLQVGDVLDATGDGIGDWTVTDFVASNGISPGLDFAEDGLVYAEVDLVPVGGGTEIEAIIGLAIPEPSSLALAALGGLALLRRRR
jgi:hypothetical protein